VPPGVHPWRPAEDDFTARIAVDLRCQLDIAEKCIVAANHLLATGQLRGVTDLYRVHATLLVRVLHDLRGSILCALAGYTMQSWTVAASCFEAAHTIGFIGRDETRAKKWLEHDSIEQSATPAYTGVENTIAFLGIEADATKRKTLVEESYAIYRYLCMAKHVNPIAERDRYIFLVDGKPNLLLTPPFTRRRRAEARLGVILAIRSTTIALWAFDAAHVSPAGLADHRVGELMLDLDSMVDTWKSDLEIAAQPPVDEEPVSDARSG
jgi:hypothetical protein